MKLWYLLTRLSLVMAVLVMVGCAGISSRYQPPSVLEQFHTMQQWSAEQFERELPRLEQAYVQQPSSMSRLRLAVALGFGRCRKCDSVRGLKLFKATLESAQDSSVVALASLCVDLLEAKALIAENNSALLNEQQRVRVLQQKLNDLTSIEESLHLRE